MGDTSVDLVQRAVSGDEEALVALLEIHGPDVRRRLVGSVPLRWQSVLEVDDILQQAYTDAFLNIRSFVSRGEGSFGAWLLTLARNCLFDAVRMMEADKRGGGRRRVEDVAGANDSRMDVLEMIGASITTPSRAVGRAEALTALDDAINRLPEPHASVIRLYDLEGRSIEEVATEIRRTTGATYMVRSRAHRMLAEFMGAPSRFLSHSP